MNRGGSSARKYLPGPDVRGIATTPVQTGQYGYRTRRISSGLGPVRRPVESTRYVMHARPASFRGSGRTLVGGRGVLPGSRDALRGRVWIQHLHRPGPALETGTGHPNAANGPTVDASGPVAGGSSEFDSLSVWDTRG